MEKWADWVITEVHYDSDHAIIISVHARPDNGDNLGDPVTFARINVVQRLENGESFITVFKGDSGWNKGADVRVIIIDHEKYIRTDRNYTKKDNLENLPEY